MVDLNNNGIPDEQEKWFLIARAFILLWSVTMLTTSYFTDTKVDQSFVVTTFTAAAASFGLQKKKEAPKSEPQGRTETPREFKDK